MSTIKTRSGRHLDILNPNPDDIVIEDVAWGLSLECRFANQCEPLYSVAQHSFLVSDIVSKELRLAALLHDASEAYLHDIPSPIKKLDALKGYRDIEYNLMLCIANKYVFRYPLPQEIHNADLLLREHEAHVFRNGEKPKSSCPVMLWSWPSHLAYSEFLKRFRSLN